jgi:hypothetical protein
MGDLCADVGLSPAFAAQLSDVCGQPVQAEFSPTIMGDHVITLQKSYRFSGQIGQIAYTASKGAVLSMTREIAVIYARRGIRANALCPGPVLTPLLAKYLSDEEKRQRRLVHIPMGRFGEAIEIANALLADCGEVISAEPPRRIRTLANRARAIDGLAATPSHRRYLLGCPGGRSLRSTYQALARLVPADSRRPPAGRARSAGPPSAPCSPSGCGAGSWRSWTRCRWTPRARRSSPPGTARDWASR